MPGIRVSITSFATFEKVSIAFDKPLVVFAGDPGTGKTLLLKLIAGPLIAVQRGRIIEPSRDLKNIINSLIPYYSEALKVDGSVLVEVEGLFRFELNGGEPEAIPRLKRYRDAGSGKLYGVALLESRVDVLQNILAPRGLDHVNQSPLHEHLSQVMEYLALEQERGDQIADQLNANMRVLLRGLVGHVVSPVNLIERRTHYGVPLYRESYTFLNLLLHAVALTIASCIKGSLVIIDAPEFGLTHEQIPRLANRLVELLERLKELGSTILMATHSPFLLASLAYLMELKGLSENEYVDYILFELDYKQRIVTLRKSDRIRLPGHILEGYRMLKKLG